MEYQLTLAALESRPIKYQLWIYDDVIVDGGSVALGIKNIKQKIDINSNSIENIIQFISIEDWQSGKAVVVGIKDSRIGDIEQMETGEISLFLSKTKQIRFASNEYTGIAPNITVQQEILNDLMVKSSGEVAIQSIVDGVMTLWQ